MRPFLLHQARSSKLEAVGLSTSDSIGAGLCNQRLRWSFPTCEPWPSTAGTRAVEASFAGASEVSFHVNYTLRILSLLLTSSQDLA